MPWGENQETVTTRQELLRLKMIWKQTSALTVFAFPYPGCCHTEGEWQLWRKRLSHAAECRKKVQTGMWSALVVVGGEGRAMSARVHSLVNLLFDWTRGCQLGVVGKAGTWGDTNSEKRVLPTPLHWLWTRAAHGELSGNDDVGGNRWTVTVSNMRI